MTSSVWLPSTLAMTSSRWAPWCRNPCPKAASPVAPMRVPPSADPCIDAPEARWSEDEEHEKNGGQHGAGRRGAGLWCHVRMGPAAHPALDPAQRGSGLAGEIGRAH